MIEVAQVFVLEKPLEFYTAVIATIGVAFWILDRRSIKAAFRAANDREINALRLRKQESESLVERSFETLKLKCQVAQEKWQFHNMYHGPLLGSGLHLSEEEEQNSSNLLTGWSLLNELRLSEPEPQCEESAVLASYIAAASRTSVQIDSLAEQIKEPQALRH